MSKNIDAAGMWTIKSNPITHDGIAMYSGKAIDADGSLGLDPNKLYPVYRPMDELVKACESFNGKPLINNHEMIGTAEGITHPDDKNIGGTICNVRRSETQNGYIVADMTIFSKEIQDLVEQGKCELSLGYWCKYKPQVGTFNGARYDFVQYDIEGNHIALVDCGRMGSTCRVYDAKEKAFVYDSMEKIMKPKKTLDADELREEIAGLLKGATDDVLAKCKDVLTATEDPAKDDDETAPVDATAEVTETTTTETEEPTTGDEGEEPKPLEDSCEGEKTGDDVPATPVEPKTEDGDDDKSVTDDDEPKSTGCDMKEVMREISRRDRLYHAVEPLVGSFDHDEMTAREVARYAADRLSLECVDGAEVEIVSGYIAGIAHTEFKSVAKRGAMDSGESNDAPSEAFKKIFG